MSGETGTARRDTVADLSRLPRQRDSRDVEQTRLLVAVGTDKHPSTGSWTGWPGGTRTPGRSG